MKAIYVCALCRTAHAPMTACCGARYDEDCAQPLTCQAVHPPVMRPQFGISPEAEQCLLGRHEADTEAKVIVHPRESSDPGSYIYVEWRDGHFGRGRQQRGFSLCTRCRCLFVEFAK